MRVISLCVFAPCSWIVHQKSMTRALSTQDLQIATIFLLAHDFLLPLFLPLLLMIILNSFLSDPYSPWNFLWSAFVPCMTQNQQHEMHIPFFTEEVRNELPTWILFHILGQTDESHSIITLSCLARSRLQCSSVNFSYVIFISSIDTNLRGDFLSSHMPKSTSRDTCWLCV